MTKDYTSYRVSDFLTDDFFVNHQLYPTPSSHKFWEEWLSLHEHSAYDEAVEVLRSIRLGLRTYETTSLPSDTRNFIFNRIKETNQKAIFIQRRKKTISWAAAASVIIALGLGYFFWQQSSAYKKNLSVVSSLQMVEKTAINTELLIHLPDGSAVKLAPRSKISFPTQFDSTKRVVILSGEATFDIAKDPAKPFLVMANEVTTKVLGTRFNVIAYENQKEVVVSVQEGKVSAFKNTRSKDPEKELAGVVLLPNQQVIFDRDSDQYQKKLIGSPNLLNTPKKTDFYFDETPLAEVIQRLETAYGIEIMYDESLLKKCQVTGRFENESLFQKLDIITKTLNGSYEIVEGKIILNSRGC